MEKNLKVSGREFNFATTYDGDSQFHVRVRSGEKLVTTFKIAADKEEDVFEAAVAHVKADIDVGNLQV